MALRLSASLHSQQATLSCLRLLSPPTSAQPEACLPPQRRREASNRILRSPPPRTPSLLRAASADGNGDGGNGATPSPPWLLELQTNGALVPSAIIGVSVEKASDHFYDTADWNSHVEVTRYWRHLLTMPSSRTVRATLGPTLFSFAQVLLFALYDALRPQAWPPLPLVSFDVFSLTGPVLSLLLVFRTDASYNRWDEARQQIGAVLIKSRNLLRLGYLAFDPSGDAAAARALTAWTVAFAVSLKVHLRLGVGEAYGETADAELTRELGSWLSEEELNQLSQVANKPHLCLQALSHLVRLAPEELASAMDDNVIAFEETLGRCERINRVPIPLSYTRHTSRFLTAWALLLPLGLWDTEHSQALVVTPLITFLLFGVDQIGVQLEQPFTVLPLERLMDKVKRDAVEQAGRHASLRASFEGLGGRRVRESV